MPASDPHGDAGDTPILVTGMPERTRQSMSWRRSMADLIRNRWTFRARSEKTEQAELGFGIEGNPHYFYVMRTEHAFGLAVFFFQEIPTTDWPDRTDGTTPFDSGGLWHGRIHTLASLDVSSMRDVFLTQRKFLRFWADEFMEYISANYDSIEEYIIGDKPRIGTYPVIPDSPNSSRAWTWEARVPLEWMSDGVMLIHGFLPEEDRQVFLDWLWDESGLDDGICDEIDLWMRGNMTFTRLGTTSSMAAEYALIGVSGR